MAALLGLDTTLKKGIFCLYVLLWVSSHLLVYASKLAGAPDYNVTSVVLLTEAIKLVMAVTLYFWYDGDAAQLRRAIGSSRPLFLRYSVPALLYCIYNNLVYANLSAFDPGTYNVLMQVRIVMTGLLYQWLFSKRLNRNQWAAIVLITIGCMCKESAKLTSAPTLHANARAWLMLLMQLLASVFAGVYTELLLKGAAGPGVTTNLQNAYMYAHSVLWNSAFLLVQGRLGEAISAYNLAVVFSPTLLTIMAIMSTVGLVTGFFLKHLDSVLKSVASATEVVLTMILSALIFSTPLDLTSVTSAVIVGGGVALYAKPVRDTHEALGATVEEGTELLEHEAASGRPPDGDQQSAPTMSCRGSPTR